jgi:hypothetical protein
MRFSQQITRQIDGVVSESILTDKVKDVVLGIVDDRLFIPGTGCRGSDVPFKPQTVWLGMDILDISIGHPQYKTNESLIITQSFRFADILESCWIVPRGLLGQPSLPSMQHLWEVCPGVSEDFGRTPEKH